MVIMIVAFTPRVYGCINAVIIYEPSIPSVGETVTFNASLSTTNWNSTIQEEIPIVSYEWDFGDGTTDEGEIVIHIYSEPGTYDVTLTITDVGGDNDTSRKQVIVELGSTDNELPWWIPVVVVAAGIGLVLTFYFMKVRKPT